MANTPISNAKAMVEYLVEKNHVSNHINHHDYRCNHVAHGVCTLFSLGASKERIQEYYKNYAFNFDPLVGPKFEIDESNWEEYIGNQKAYEELLQFFEKQMSTRGLANTLAKFLPRLLPGFVGGAFHPLIQIGIGIEYDFPQVVAEGLAYACTYYFKVGEIINRVPDTEVDSLTPMQIAQQLTEMKLAPPKVRSPKFPIDEILDHYDSDVAQLVSKWKLNDVSTTEGVFKKLAELSFAILVVTFGSYRNRTIDFFLVHNVTSLQAIRVMLPLLPLNEQKRLLQLTLVGLLGNMWLQGMPNFELRRILEYSGPLEEISWNNIKEKAIASDDEHVAKTVRALQVIRDNIPDSMIQHELTLRCALMATDFITKMDDWEFDGIGFCN